MLFGALYAIVDTEYRLLRQIMQHLKATTYCALIASDLKKSPESTCPRQAQEVFASFLENWSSFPMNIKNQFTLFEQRRKIWLANQILTIIIDFFCMYSIKFFKKIKYRRFINLYSEQYRLKEKMLSRVVSDLAHFLKDGAKVKYVLSEIKSPF